MEKVCFFFGAGAEQSFGISGGKDFASSVLGINDDELNSAVNSYYKNKRNTLNDDWYPQYSKSVWDEDKLLEACIKKKELDGKYPIKINKKEDFQAEFERLKKSKKEMTQIISEYTSYMGILDESFHSLINPRIMGPRKFWRVVSCYTRAYASLLAKMQLPLKKQSKENYLSLLEKPCLSIEIMNNFAIKHYNEDSYYKILNQKVHQNQRKVITTNYTTLCEKIANINSDSIAYIHGKFGWFESSKNLQVFDVSKDILPNNDILFPYIFIQSGIKPIVDEIQISEYAKMLKFLNTSDYIVMVGYRINIDDNHINSIIRSYILKGRILVYFDFENSGKFEILRRLRLDTTKEKFIDYIPINKTNCLFEFKNKIDELEQKKNGE